jgi:hypothetical protein
MPLTYKRLRVEKNINKNISNGDRSLHCLREKKIPPKTVTVFNEACYARERDFKIISSKQVLTSFITNLGMRAEGHSLLF